MAGSIEVDIYQELLQRREAQDASAMAAKDGGSHLVATPLRVTADSAAPPASRSQATTSQTSLPESRVAPAKNAFMFFAEAHRTATLQAHPLMSIVELSRVLGQMWTALSSAEKQPYIELAAHDQRYLQGLGERGVGSGDRNLDHTARTGPVIQAAPAAKCDDQSGQSEHRVEPGLELSQQASPRCLRVSPPRSISTSPRLVSDNASKPVNDMTDGPGNLIPQINKITISQVKGGSICLLCGRKFKTVLLDFAMEQHQAGQQCRFDTQRAHGKRSPQAHTQASPDITAISCSINDNSSHITMSRSNSSRTSCTGNSSSHLPVPFEATARSAEDEDMYVDLLL